MGNKTHEVCSVVRVRHIVLVLLLCDVCLGPVQEKKETNENVARNESMYLPGTAANGREETRVVF